MSSTVAVLDIIHLSVVVPLVVSVEQLLDLVSDRIPSFKGMKFSGPDLMGLSRCIAKYGSRYQIMYSSEPVSMPLRILCIAASQNS